MNSVNTTTVMKLSKGRLLYKILNGFVPHYLTSFFKYSISKPGLRSASQEKLMYPNPKCELLRNSFLFKTVKIWNSIPLEIRNQPITAFKQNLKKCLLTQSPIWPSQ